MTVEAPLIARARKAGQFIIVQIDTEWGERIPLTIAAEFDVPIMVSLNTIMIDGTGMCGGCRVTVGKEIKFVCVDGPEFDGHKVDFDNMMIRMRAYKEREVADHHTCHIGLGLPPHQAPTPSAPAPAVSAPAQK
jgi:hypothetical protein